MKSVNRTGALRAKIQSGITLPSSPANIHDEVRADRLPKLATSRSATIDIITYGAFAAKSPDRFGMFNQLP